MILPVPRRASAALKPTAAAVVAMSIATFSGAQAQSLAPTVESVVITASRTPQSARDVLSDFVIIDAGTLANAGQGTLVDVLQQTRGIEISRYGGGGNSASVFIRGASNMQSIVLVDGIRIGSSALGGATWETIPLSRIERVEIVFGPLSSLYGADAMGGVIQIFTKQGSGKPRTTASAGAGTHATRIADAGVSGSSGMLRYAFGAAHEESEGFSATRPGAGPYTYNADDDGYDKDSATGQFSLAYAPGHEAGVHFLHSRLDTQFDAGPGYDDRNRFTLGSAAVYSRNRLLPSWTSLLQLSRADDKGSTDASYGKGHSDTTQTQLSWQNDIALGSDVLQLVAERRVEEVDTDSPAVSGERSTNSLAAAYQLRRGRHLVSAGLRHDRSSQYGSRNTGSVEYGYRISDALRASASYGTSFRAPTFNELYYPGYGIASNQPERGRNAEAGLYYSLGATRLSAVYYRNRISNLIVSAAVCPVEQDSHPWGCAYNVNQALLTGITLGGERAFGPLALRASLDVQDPRDETAGTRLARRAKRHGSIAAEYQAAAYKAGAELVFASDRFDDTANTVRLGGYGVLNLYGSHDIARDWSLFARWNNVSGKDYELVRHYATSGSSLFVGIRHAMQ